MEGSGWVIGFFRPTHLSVFWMGLISHMVGEMVTKCSYLNFNISWNYFCILFSQNLKFISYVKELLHLSMRESKLWYCKAVTKNMKGN